MYISSSDASFDPKCIWTNRDCKSDDCLKETINKCSTKIRNSNGQPYHCYVVWQNTTEGVAVQLRGCVSGKEYKCSNSSLCIERNRSPKNGLYFCCCSTNLCNEDFHLVSPEELNKIELEPNQATPPHNFDSYIFWLSIYILIPSIIILGIILIASWYQRNKSRTFSKELGSRDESVPINEQSFYRFNNLELIEQLARGRFGAVWKARLPSENCIDEKWVAVKIFPSHEKDSWLAEQQVFMLPKFEHENILPFLGFEKRSNDEVPFEVEYWIVSEFHELGSLYDHLKSNTIGFNDLLKISEGIARGLAHLHDEIPSTNGPKKLAVAHRDLKSKNILLKSDLTPRISDFGLCLIFYPDRLPTDLGQVGTHRYMAPEVLDGAINFSRDALTRTDMYACGLVFWELLSRCKGENETIVPDDYSPPFQKEIAQMETNNQEFGPNPGLEVMQKIVCQNKKRPKIKSQWRAHPFLSQMCETIEECWDQDAEARLSASCVLERVSSLKKAETHTVDDQ